MGIHNPLDAHVLNYPLCWVILTGAGLNCDPFTNGCLPKPPKRLCALNTETWFWPDLSLLNDFGESEFECDMVSFSLTCERKLISMLAQLKQWLL